MNRQPPRYSIGRALSVLFISSLLGGVWGVTAVTVLGIIVWMLGLGEAGWHLLAAATLMLSYMGVEKVSGRTPPQADDAEVARSHTDSLISSWSFAAAYILAWAAIWALLASRAAIVVF